MPAKHSSHQTADLIIRNLKVKKSVEPYKLTTDVKRALKKFLEYNDSVSRHERVTIESALQFLQDQGLPCTLHKFKKIIKVNFGRSWSSQ